MQRSSEGIASPAAALAKAQIELINPEKSLIGTLSSDDSNGPERAFRYAPLSSGLDIVRKVLRQHEIATVQTVDQTAGIINLTTILPHASGEWIASDWPVCAVTEKTTPHRMGAALTYARRYALFALVGIAGEDDLDAPDRVTPTTQASSRAKSYQEKLSEQNNGDLNSGQRDRASTLASRRDRARPKALPLVLGAQESRQLRERLVAELNYVGSGDDAAAWAHRRLAEKNALLATDAQHVEDAFAARVAVFAADLSDTALTSTLPEREATSPALKPDTAVNPARPGKQRRSRTIDKSVLTFPEPRRIRDRDQMRFIAKQPCLICGRQPADAHNVRFAQSPALGRKVSDEFTVPLCRGHTARFIAAAMNRYGG